MDNLEKPPVNIRLSSRHRDALLLGLIALLSVVGYVSAGLLQGVSGFPLDDAWIHQTFARNFAADLTWSFQSGQASGGSTGPAYGVLLSVLHAAGLPIVWGTHALGFLFLWGTSFGGYLLAGQLLPEYKKAPLICGILIALEWHLVWAALSGMETLLLGLISIYLFYWLLNGGDNDWIPGLLVGISIWVRPDGLTLAGPVLLVLLFSSRSWTEKGISVAKFLVSPLVLLGSYFLFNHLAAGDFWPNTFFAKQAEYAVLRQENILLRYGKVSAQLITGIGAVLLPGLVAEGWDAWRSRDWARAGMLAWLVGYVGIYAWRLPVVYQHGRYVMPAMPIFFLLSAAGTRRIIRLESEMAVRRIISRTIIGAGALVLALFWVLGARAYARDVGVIETEMVRVARWVNENTAADAVIGAHDIGALRYFGNREILDLAGLITPDVIPFIRDEGQLALYLDRNRADYLVTFPGWYPDLVRDLHPVYQSDGSFSEIFGNDHMTVYRWE